MQILRIHCGLAIYNSASRIWLVIFCDSNVVGVVVNYFIYC